MQCDEQREKRLKKEEEKEIPGTHGMLSKHFTFMLLGH